MQEPARPDALDYDAEVRFGVVMYGGVSLAVYIHGVTHEMHALARATPRFAVARADFGGTEAVYRRLSRLVNDPALVERQAALLADASGGPDPLDEPAGAVRTRFVIDVIAGTSAGGLNGLFLGKALANDEPLAPLQALWLREADFGALLNDRQAYRDPDLRQLPDRSAEPKSLLSGDRMYRKLRSTLKAMSDARAEQPAGTSPWVDELDLFVTTTDVRGAVVPLRLFDKVVHEKRHRQVFHFRYTDDGVRVVDNDLAADNEPFLAFAARCTSAFPFAFEPMTLGSLPTLEPGLTTASLARWNRFFPGLPPAEVAGLHHLQRGFGDGGYLDNKPFSYVVQTLASRTASVPVERKLVYVEPSPARLADDLPVQPPPDALGNAMAALTSIPRYETIREDLEAVLRRNRRIERIDRIVRLGERDLDNAPEDPMARVLADNDGHVPDWRTRTTEQMRLYYGDAFLPYSRLRQYTVTDAIADRLAKRWSLAGDTDQVYALRAVVRAWREEAYTDQPHGDVDRPTANAFLADFDLAYRVRRNAFLLRKADQLMRLFARRRQGPLQQLSEADAALIGRMARRVGLVLDQPLADDALLASALAALHRLKADFARADIGLRHAPDLPADDAGHATRRAALRPALLGMLRLVLSPGSEPASFEPALNRLPSASRSLQELVFRRAQVLLTEAESRGLAPLRSLLEDDIAGLKAWIGGLIAGPPGADADQRSPSRLVWEHLGAPRLAVVTREDGPRRVEVAVDPATGLTELDSLAGLQLRRFLGEYYLRFDTYDQMSFPLYYDTGSGEAATVEVFRISPEDAPSLIDETTDPRRKLAGTALANFAAFLERHWRANDMLWGRLDGAERLIAALLPGQEPATATVRRALTLDAHRCILRESLVASGQQTLSTLLVDALAEIDSEQAPVPPAAPSRGLSPADLQRRREALTAALLARLAPATPESRRRLEQIVSGLLDDDALIAWVKTTRDVDRTPDPQPLLDAAARAVTITGRLLQTSVHERGADVPALRWIARAGLVAQGLLAVSMPGALKARWWSHGMKLLYAFELVMLLIGFGLGSEPVRTVALTALGVTAALHLSTLLLGDVLASRRGWRAKSLWMAGVPLLLFAALGVLALWRVGWQALLGIG